MKGFVMKTMVLFLSTVTTLMLSENALAKSTGYAMALEMDPFMTAFSLIPGLSSFSGGAELAVCESLSWRLGYGRLGASFDDDQLKDQAKAQDASEPTFVHDFIIQTLSPSLRYYTHGARDSFYGGLGGAFSWGQADITYEDRDYSIESRHMAARLDLGYRWLWESGVMVRLGGALSLPVSRSSEIKASSGETLADNEIERLKDHEEDVKKEAKPTGSLDLALGVAI